MNYTSILVFDLETNGIGDFRPPTQTITQLAFVKFTPEGRVLKEYSQIIKGATQIKNHPSVTITLNQIRNEGIDKLQAIQTLINNIDSETLLCSHNFEFDSGLIKRAIDNSDLSFPNNFGICTMKASTDYCKLPKLGAASKYPGYKFPTLEELANKLNVSIDSSKFHDALYDCHITKECFLQGINNGLFNDQWTLTITTKYKDITDTESEFEEFI